MARSAIAALILKYPAKAHSRHTFQKIQKGFFVMKKKKSRIELAREIIANLRQGMNRPAATEAKRNSLPEATPFMPLAMATSRPTRPQKLQPSHF